MTGALVDAQPLMGLMRSRGVSKQADRAGKQQHPGLHDTATVIYPIVAIDFHHRARNCKKELDGTRKVARVFLSSQRFNSGKRFFGRVATSYTVANRCIWPSISASGLHLVVVESSSG